MIKLNDKQANKLKASIYASADGVIDFNRARNLYSDIMLITASCGRGKTAFSLSLAPTGLLARVNAKQRFDALTPVEDIKPEEMLFLTTRANIKSQQLRKATTTQAFSSDFNTEVNAFEDANRQGKIRVTTAHQFGMWVKAGLINKPPRLLVLDEMHSIFAETVFADDLLYTLEFLKDYYNDMIKIGLTATPEFLFDYIQKEEEEMRFAVIDKDLGSKYKCDNIKALIGGSAKTVLKQLNIDSNNKAIIYMQSATENYKAHKEFENAGFIISKGNEGKNEEGQYFVDVMKEEGTRDYVLENEALPQNIDRLFINSASREGMNIQDDSVKYIICEAVDMITIQQVLGRVRGDMKQFIVVCNNRYKEMNEKNIDEFTKFLKVYAETANKEGVLMARYARQDENKNLQKLVYKYKDEYRINYYARAYMQYIQESYIQVNGCKKTYNKQQGFYQEENAFLLMIEKCYQVRIT